MWDADTLFDVDIAAIARGVVSTGVWDAGASFDAGCVAIARGCGPDPR